MEEEDFEGCISCMQTNDLCDLFTVYAENSETYAKILESCFNVKVANDLKYICAQCVQKLEDAVTFKDQTTKSMAMLHGIKDEEYLDEALLEEDEVITPDLAKGNKVGGVQKANYDPTHDMDDDPESMEVVDDNQCIYCDMVLPSHVGLNNHIRVTHGLQPRDDARGPRHDCELCAAVFHTTTTLREHMERCHGVLRPGDEGDNKQFPCHFCENIYTGRKACYTHLRMKHGLKLSTEKAAKLTPRIRKKCHICNKDFSQKQILNKHLWKEHGYEVEKRKAFLCPLCDERVSYGHHFDQHLVSEHRLKQHIELLQFPSMDDFMIYKSQIQEETKCRFRKTTASKHTIEGLRSHYMCSQSGVYVYQGKGIRPAPERQIYKTGKACPAHMIVTESVDCVRVTFHATHVGHGACPYYEPREPRKPKSEPLLPCTATAAAAAEPSDPDGEVKDEDDADAAAAAESCGGGGGGGGASARGWMCEACGLAFLDGVQFREHAARHGARHLCPCHYCPEVFQNVDAWTRHLRTEHNVGTLF